jgi:glycosyltransferase involved in cell wall biosynthesis
VTTPDISVIVCSHNGERTLPVTLAHVRQQTLSRSRYEVIVVDDGSDDDTSALARAAGVQVVRLAIPAGLAAARNAGVGAAAGAIVAFTDDDCAPARNWLAALSSSFADAAVDGVGGKVVPDCRNGFLLRYLQARNPLTPLPAELLACSSAGYRLRLYLRSVVVSEPEPAAGAPLYCAVGANMAFRRELIVELGGFDEAFTFGGEEEDLCRRAHSRPHGARLRHEPDAVVVHRFEPRPGDLLRRARAYGIGNARGAIKHHDRRPIVYPFPILISSAILRALKTGRRATLALGLLAPLATYSRWPVRAWRERSVEPLAYPYLQLAQEACTMLGELQGWHAGYDRARARDPGP